MSDHQEPERVWDEYDWERFLQQQDRKTERYMELLEKYIDDPNRDQIIAREMGWHRFANPETEWLDNPEGDFEDLFDDESDEDDLVGEAEDDDEAEEESFELHPLYQASFALTIWIDQLFEELGDLQNHPSAVRLATQSAVASAKLAAALSDDDVEEIGMTIAYLKRALKAVTTAMDAGRDFAAEVKLDPQKAATLTARLFQIRDGIITLMGEYRGEWRRRYGK